MNISFVYLLTQLWRRILDFFYHWYIDGFLRGAHWSYNFLERLDKIFALRITLKNLFQPLFQDYSLIGYLWGFIFRLLRLIMGSIIYIFFVAISFMLYIIWAAIPVFVIYKIIIG